MVLGSVMGGFAYSMMRQMGGASVPPNMPAQFALMNIVFQNFGVLLVLQGLVALVAVWAGIALLQLKAWARTTIEVLSWLTLAYCIGFGIYWVYLWLSMTGQMPKGGGPVDTDMFQILGVVMGVVVIVAFAVPLWIMIRYLRGAEVRAAVATSEQVQGHA